ncbi:MAG: hypothetical protein MI739_14925 [Bacteroidales bacterium]|nr:hypothetical protein [Bacteroidales bacterium]
MNKDIFFGENITGALNNISSRTGVIKQADRNRKKTPRFGAKVKIRFWLVICLNSLY